MDIWLLSTSQDENDFIITNIADDNCWWLGGYQPDDTPDSYGTRWQVGTG